MADQKNPSTDHDPADFEAKILSDKELQRIESLPIQTFEFAGLKASGHFDEKERIFYLVEKGKLTGRAFRVGEEMTNQPKDPPPTKAEPPNTSQKEESSKDKLIDFLKRLAGNEEAKEKAAKKQKKNRVYQEGEESPQEAEKRTRKKAFKLIFGALAVMFFLFFFLKIFMPGVSGGDPAQSGSAPEENGLNNIVVVQVTHDMIPGDVITAEDIQESTISAESYNEITLSDAKLYQWDRHDSLIDKYVVSYIPKGQYLTYNNIDTVYTPVPNPWVGDMNGYELVSIPVPEEVVGDEKLNYGAVVDLKITKRTVNEANLNADETTSTEGIQHDSSVEQSYIIDTYSLQATIVDLLDPQGNSLYDTFYSWLQIPAGEQGPYLKNKFLEDPDVEESIAPTYISIKVTADQAKELTDILSDDSEVVYSFTDNTDTDTEEKTNFAAQVRALFLTIGDAEKEAEAERALEDTETDDKEADSDAGNSANNN